MVNTTSPDSDEAEDEDKIIIDMDDEDADIIEEELVEIGIKPDVIRRA